MPKRAAERWLRLKLFCKSHLQAEYLVDGCIDNASRENVSPENHRKITFKLPPYLCSESSLPFSKGTILLESCSADNTSYLNHVQCKAHLETLDGQSLRFCVGSGSCTLYSILLGQRSKIVVLQSPIAPADTTKHIPTSIDPFNFNINSHLVEPTKHSQNPSVGEYRRLAGVGVDDDVTHLPFANLCTTDIKVNKRTVVSHPLQHQLHPYEQRQRSIDLLPSARQS